ncbi:hypothetical protein L7F22_052215 [Adiantum nelumboides]|nr:hypothetical protein [Adiantum nelumboides]
MTASTEVLFSVTVLVLIWQTGSGFLFRLLVSSVTASMFSGLCNWLGTTVLVLSQIWLVLINWFYNWLVSVTDWFLIMLSKSDDMRAEMAKIPYASAVGSLMYAMVATRPDIAFAVGVVSRYMSNPGKKHWEAVKCILRYLKGTKDLCICFGKSETSMHGFTDADFAGHPDCRKSTSGYVFTFTGGAVSWISKLQKCVALSTTEAEYVAATEASKEALWLMRLVEELGIKSQVPVVHCDSQSAIMLARNPVFHAKPKHIEVKYHFIRSMLDDKSITLVKVHTDDNPANLLTKSLPAERFAYCRQMMGIG